MLSSYAKLICLFLMGFVLPGMVTSGAEAPTDALIFGSEASEKAHGLGSYDISKTEVYVGQAGLKARRLLPDARNPYAGKYPGTYGGEITFMMKVDGTAQNYLTGKFSGDETTDGRILLVVDDKEVGSRHGPDEAYFEGMHGPVCPGAFYYRTAPLPRSLTDGKSEVEVRLRSTGSYYAYGKPHVYETYQKVMDKPSRGIYGIYTHTDPGILPDQGPILGATPSYADLPSKESPSLKDLRDKQITEINEKIKGMLDDKRIPGHNAAWNPLEMLALAYFRPELKEAYKNPAVLQKVCDIIDELVRQDNAGKLKASGEWGGLYGRWGNAFVLVADQIKPGILDEKIDLGKGLVPRREQWIRIFKESCEFGAANRRTISNQEMFASISVFGAALALDKLDPLKYRKHVEVGYHHILQCCGIEEFTGNAKISSSGTLELGNPKDAFSGPGYYFTTLKGTTHEPGWVSADCYGNQGNAFGEMYQMTKAYLGGEGDKRVLETAVKHGTIQGQFTYAWAVDGFRAILAEGFDCVRNQYVPGKVFYGSGEAAGLSQNPVLMGYMKQSFEDGQLGTFEAKRMSAIWGIDLFQGLMDHGSEYKARVPTSPDQPDNFTADEENGMISIKHGREQLVLNMYYRTSLDNKLVQAHHVTQWFERFIEMRPQRTEYRTEGKSKARGSKVTSWSGDAPDNPVSAYTGQEDRIPLGKGGILDLYQVRYGKYFVAMNSARDGKEMTIEFPKDLVGKEAFAMHLSKTVILPDKMQIPILTSYVFLLKD